MQMRFNPSCDFRPIELDQIIKSHFNVTKDDQKSYISQIMLHFLVSMLLI